MRIVTGIGEARAACKAARADNMDIALAPTMGALHAGHEALIEAARRDGGFVVVSIFVNPTQFGANEDYTRYPRPLEADLAIADRHEVDLVWTPTVEEMYPPGAAVTVHAGRLADHLCGASRPGHFDGVATVVAKLFNVIQPDRAYFGKKDYQQWRIILQMALDLNLPVRIVAVPTIRESDGLALSSRNAYLTPEERAAAKLIPIALRNGAAIGGDDPGAVKQAVEAALSESPIIRIDYVEIVDESVQPVERIAGGSRLCVAAWVGKTRLIDNRALGAE